MNKRAREGTTGQERRTRVGAMNLGVAVVRVPHQPSTKWLVLLAAVLAAVISWWQHRDELERASRAPARSAPEEAERVEIEVELVTD